MIILCMRRFSGNSNHRYDLSSLLKENVRGKYAKRYEQGTNPVLLSLDVAKDFPNDETVNEALRLVIQLKKIPGSGKRRAIGL